MDETRNTKLMENAREDLRDFFCGSCREYKGMVDCEECGNRYCEFCELPCCEKE